MTSPAALPALAATALLLIGGSIVYLTRDRAEVAEPAAAVLPASPPPQRVWESQALPEPRPSTQEMASQAELERRHQELAAEEEAKRQEAARVVPAPLPQAFRQPASWDGFGPAQITAIEGVRTEFLGEMKAAGDPNSPEYLRHWFEAQRRADQKLMAYLGAKAFNQLYGE